MKRWFWLLVGMLLVVSLSCGLLPGRGRGNNDAPETAATVVVARGSEGESDVDEPDADEGLSVDPTALDQISSYRATIMWRSEKGADLVESFTMHQSATRDPAAQRMVIDSDDGDMEFIQIGNDTWVRFGDEWMQSSSDSPSDFGDMFASDDWLSNVGAGGYEFVGRATVNGIKTRHYRVEYTNHFLNWFDAEDEADAITDGSAEVWIADERGLPRFTVKSVIVMTGTSDGESIKITMSQDVTDVNKSFTIEAPEGVGGLPDGLPIYAGATDVTSMAAFTIFTAPDDMETVNAFYVDALSSAGWSQVDEGMSFEEMISSSWDKDGKTLSLMVSSSSGETSVMISVEE
jgi:hypothetical protein